MIELAWHLRQLIKINWCFFQQLCTNIHSLIASVCGMWQQRGRFSMSSSRTKWRWTHTVFPQKEASMICYVLFYKQCFLTGYHPLVCNGLCLYAMQATTNSVSSYHWQDSNPLKWKYSVSLTTNCSKLEITFGSVRQNIYVICQFSLCCYLYPAWNFCHNMLLLELQWIYNGISNWQHCQFFSIGLQKATLLFVYHIYLSDKHLQTVF